MHEGGYRHADMWTRQQCQASGPATKETGADRPFDRIMSGLAGQRLLTPDLCGDNRAIDAGGRASVISSHLKDRGSIPMMQSDKAHGTSLVGERTII